MTEQKLDLKRAVFHSTDYPGVVYLESSARSPDGKLERTYYIRYRTPDGRQRFEKAGGQRRNKMTPAKASAIRAARSRGTELPNRVRREEKRAAEEAEATCWTFDKLWKAWQEDPENAGKRGTIKTDQRYRKHISADPDDEKNREKSAPPPLGDREPKDVRLLDIDRIRLFLARDHAKSTTISVISLIRRIERYGASTGRCPGLPFPIVLRGKTLGRDPKVKRAPTDDQVDAYMKTCREWPDVQAGAFQLFIAFTGIRRGSVQRLKWEDIDLDRQTAVLKDSKTGDVQIVLSDDAVALLRSHEATRKEENSYVFQGSDPDGKRSQRQIDREPRKIADTAGLPKDLDPCHCFRRRLATKVEAAYGIATAMKAGGWKSSAMVLNYTSVGKQIVRDAVNLLGRRIPEAKAETA